MKSKKRLFIIALSSLLAMPAAAATFQVEHDHLFRSCKGTLVFNDTTIEYSTEKRGHSRIWKYQDIQQLEIAHNRVSILTYEVRKSALGADRVFNFKVLSGDVTDRLRQELENKLTRPLVSSVVPAESEARYSIPARHRRFLDGSEGLLELCEDYIIYRATKPEDSRIWRFDELLSFGSTGPFQLRLGAVQKTGGEYGEEKNYVFDLKRKLEPEEYDFIWEKINRRTITPGRRRH